jgi:uncharacterized protein (DUF885 family)
MHKSIRKLLSVFVFISFLALGAFSVEAQTESAKFKQLAADYWENALVENPMLGTYSGDNRFDDKLQDISEAAYKRRYAAAREFLKRAARIKAKKLTAEEQISLRILRRNLGLRIEGEQFYSFADEFSSPRNYLMPMSQLLGFHLAFLGLPDVQPFLSVKDYENYIARLRAFPKQADDAVVNMRKGISLGFVQPKAIVERMFPQLEAGAAADAKKSPLYAPVARFPKEFSDAEKARLAAAIEQAITTDVAPAFQKLSNFIKTEYLPKSRETLGFSALPNGRKMFELFVRASNTTDLSPAEIHALGLRELAKIDVERKKILKEMKFDGTIGEFWAKLNTDKSLRWFDAAAVERNLRDSLQFIEARLPQVFADIPPINYEIKQVPAYSAASAPSGQYVPPSEDGTRLPIFYYNTYKIETNGIRKFTMPRLAFHESLPGHQLQDLYARRNKDLPAFRRYGYNGAYAEGWAIYSENLADELGAFRGDANARYYYLSNLASVYADLVIETGIHDLGWTREQAFAFARNELQDARSDEEIERNTARIAGQPSQKLNYGLGVLKILELREQAKKELGTRFDIRAFHNLVLRSGNVPLDVLDELAREWITRQKRSEK